MWYIIVLLAFLIFGGQVGRGQDLVDREMLAQIKRDSRILESIIGEVLRQNFENPFAIAAEPQASYLQGYGVVVSFHLKINRGTIRGFYGEIRNSGSRSTVSKTEQLEKVERIMVQALADYGSTVKQLSSTDKVTICAHIEDRNELDPSKNRTDMIISARRQDIDQYLMKRITFEEFEKRIRLTEY